MPRSKASRPTAGASTSKVGVLAEKLFATKDGAKAAPLWTKLEKLAVAGDVEARGAVTAYVDHGPIGFVRGFLASALFKFVSVDDATCAPTFERGLDDADARYWCIRGLMKTQGESCYARLCALALDESIPTEDRACAVKELSVHAKQPFDAGLPEDPGHWNARDLHTDRIVAWQLSGFPRGAGTPKPIPPNPHEHLARIREKFPLPADYEQFLLAETTSSSRGRICAFHAHEVLEGQVGYSIHGLTGAPISSWPSGFLVIATKDADPYVLDTLGGGAVLFAEHGTGSWNFDEVAPSFHAFRRRLTKR